MDTREINEKIIEAALKYKPVEDLLHCVIFNVSQEESTKYFFWYAERECLQRSMKLSFNINGKFLYYYVLNVDYDDVGKAMHVILSISNGTDMSLFENSTDNPWIKIREVKKDINKNE